MRAVFYCKSVFRVAIGAFFCFCIGFNSHLAMHGVVVQLGWAAGHIAAIFELYPQPITSELLWRVPYDNQSRAAGPVGIGHTP
jgi:hypothetical protein